MSCSVSTVSDVGTHCLPNRSIFCLYWLSRFSRADRSVRWPWQQLSTVSLTNAVKTVVWAEGVCGEEGDWILEHRAASGESWKGKKTPATEWGCVARVGGCVDKEPMGRTGHGCVWIRTCGFTGVGRIGAELINGKLWKLSRTQMKRAQPMQWSALKQMGRMDTEDGGRQ